MPAIKSWWYTTGVEFVPVLSPGYKQDHTEIRENAFNLFLFFSSLIPWYHQFLFDLQLESDITVYGDSKDLVRVKSYANNAEQNTGGNKIYSVLGLKLNLP